MAGNLDTREAAKIQNSGEFRLAPLLEPESPRVRVLVADEDEMVIELLREYLRVRGFDVLVAFDGREALDILQNEQVEALVVDERIPRIGPAALIEAARNAARPSGCVVMGAAPGVAAVMSAWKAGAVEFLVKPFRLAELHTAVGIAAGEAARIRHVRLLEDRCRLFELLSGNEGRVDPGRLYSLFARVAAGLTDAEEVAIWVFGQAGWTPVARGGLVRRLASFNPEEVTEVVEGPEGLLAMRLSGSPPTVVAVARGGLRSRSHKAAFGAHVSLLERVDRI
jgi:DNA-binding response OmpR family regulator